MRTGKGRSTLRLSSLVQIALLSMSLVLAFVLPLVPTARAATVNVSIVDFAFQPKTVNVILGDTVVWTNNGGVTHTVTSDGGSGPLNSGSLGSSGTYQFTFTSEGTYDYHCSLHPSMTGTVVVGSFIPEYSSAALVALGLMAVLVGIAALGRKR